MVNKSACSYIYFYYFILCTLVHWHARTLPTREAAVGGFSGVQTNWHARWDMVLLPSLLLCGRRIRLRLFSNKHSMRHDGP